MATPKKKQIHLSDSARQKMIEHIIGETGLSPEKASLILNAIINMLNGEEKNAKNIVHYVPGKISYSDKEVAEIAKGMSDLFEMPYDNLAKELTELSSEPLRQAKEFEELPDLSKLRFPDEPSRQARELEEIPANLDLTSVDEVRRPRRMQREEPSYELPVSLNEERGQRLKSLANIVRYEDNNDTNLFHFRIDQEPLTFQNLTSILSALLELSTKYWLISKSRFANLIEYTQTHNPRFAVEANVRVTKITYNSPVNINLGAQDIAQALITTIDGIAQVEKRFRKAELEIHEKEQVINDAQQKSVHEQRMNELEQDRQQLEIEKQRLELQKQTLEIQQQQIDLQKKSFEYSIEMATKVIDMLNPGIDPNTRAMAIQAVLPNWIQLQNSTGLELILPPDMKTKVEEKK